MAAAKKHGGKRAGSGGVIKGDAIMGVLSVRMTLKQKKHFAEWGGADKLRAVLTHWDATRKGKARVAA